MKGAIHKVLLLTGVVAIAGCASPGYYQPYDSYQYRNTLGGAAVGAAGGALLGHAIGDGADDALVGGALGAMVGGAVGYSMDQKQKQDVYGNPYPRYDGSYRPYSDQRGKQRTYSY